MPRTLTAGAIVGAAAPMVRDLHERMDGHGYPRGVEASGSPLGARIVSVADAYDAMTHMRVYRDAMSHAHALAEIERAAGVQFDPRVVEALRQATAPATP